MEFGALLEHLLAKRSLDQEEAFSVMSQLMDGSLEPAQMGALLTALRFKGATGPELAGFASAMRKRAVDIPRSAKSLLDTCGTGGGPSTFNISTASAIVVAAAGVPVAKHGNRAVTSRCGSADVLEALGVVLLSEPEAIGKVLDQAGLAFLFAPHHHPAMKHAGPVRRSLGIRTVFNFLGPLSNPAAAERQVIGIYDASMMDAVAEAAKLLGIERGCVVHATDGLDEVSPVTLTSYRWVEGESVTGGTWTPEEFGLGEIQQACLEAGETVEENAAFLREAISDAGSDRAKVIVPSVAVALWVADRVGTLEAGAELALEVIGSGKAKEKLEEFVDLTRQFQSEATA